MVDKRINKFRFIIGCCHIGSHLYKCERNKQVTKYILYTCDEERDRSCLGWGVWKMQTMGCLQGRGAGERLPGRRVDHHEHRWGAVRPAMSLRDGVWSLGHIGVGPRIKFSWSERLELSV